MYTHDLKCICIDAGSTCVLYPSHLFNVFNVNRTCSISVLNWCFLFLLMSNQFITLSVCACVFVHLLCMVHDIIVRVLQTLAVLMPTDVASCSYISLASLKM